MFECCSSFLSLDDLQIVYKWILATQFHSQTKELDLQFLLDIDLAILASESQRFQQYEQQIRKEYSWIELTTYTQKRVEILEHFYKKKPLYQTQYFQNHFEKKAKENLSTLWG